jgi:hypothetical protein
MNANMQQFGALTGAPDWMNYTLPIPDLGPMAPMTPMAPLTGPTGLGSDGGKGGTKGGPDLSRGEADIGYGKAGATADTTTTATNSWGDFLSSLAVGLFGGPISQASYAMFGKTPVSAMKDYALSQLFGPPAPQEATLASGWGLGQADPGPDHVPGTPDPGFGGGDFGGPGRGGGTGGASNDGASDHDTGGPPGGW